MQDKRGNYSSQKLALNILGISVLYNTTNSSESCKNFAANTVKLFYFKNVYVILSLHKYSNSGKTIMKDKKIRS
jgi:hypothetical protein